MPWMAFADADQRQSYSPKCAVFLHRQTGIFRAGWIEAAAIADPRAENILIPPDYCKNQFLHARALPNNVRSSARALARSVPVIARRGRTMKSMGASSGRALRNSSRTRRRSEARSTARGAVLRLITIPRQAGCEGRFCLARTRKKLPWKRCGKAPVKCAAPLSRILRGRVARA
jgi:hypothetical protein